MSFIIGFAGGAVSGAAALALFLFWFGYKKGLFTIPGAKR